MEKMGYEMWHKKDVDLDDNDVERVRQSEKLIKFLSLAKNIPALKGRSVKEVFSTEEGKRDFIKGLDTEEFIGMLRGINALLRGEEVDSSEMEFENMRAESSFLNYCAFFPNKKDKPGLYAYLLSSMKEMNEAGRDMREIALLCGLSINAIHGFRDGNGRTSRFVFKMLSENFNDTQKDELRDLLSTEKNDAIRVNPGFLEGFIRELVAEELGIKNNSEDGWIRFRMGGDDEELKVILESKMTKDAAAELQSRMEGDDYFMILAICDHFKGMDILESNIEVADQNLNDRLLDIKKILDVASAKDVDGIYGKYWGLKKRYVETLMDIFVHPEEKKYQRYFGKNIGERSLKDFAFDRVIEEKWEELRDPEEYIGFNDAFEGDSDSEVV